MKTLLQSVLVLIFLLTADLYPQQQILSTGKAPFNKAASHANYGTFPLAYVAYANDNSTSSNISIQMPDGHPFTVLGSFSAPNFASSMCKGGDGNFYLIDVAPALYLFDINSGTCTLIGNIVGMGGDQPNGISYNVVNNKYYLVSSNALYLFDLVTLQATLIGQFTPTISGLMIDLCFDEDGTCFAYEVNINPGAANGYIIDITNAHLTTLGYLGYTPNYGQGMSYDLETSTIYLSAFNSDTFSGQLRTMDKTTGMTTLIYDWGDQIAPFALESMCCGPCPVEAASNPNPPSGAIDISVDGTTLTWTNGSGTSNVEVWLGPTGSITQVYSGVPITSWQTGALQYFTTYHWYIVDGNDSCGTNGPSWTFQTEQNPNLCTFNFYPQSAQFWTGNTEGTTKTDGEINTVFPNVGWGAFDISSIPQGSQVQDVTFSGYVISNSWPYWSATPMGSVNPVTADGATINGQIQASWDQSVAYVFINETGTISPGWYTYTLANSGLSDLQAAVNSGQGYFATGFVDRDFTATYFINFDGWSQPNPPYITVTYVPIPVELTSFRADVQSDEVMLNWATASETNNKGFEIERKGWSRQYAIGNRQNENKWEKVGFVEGNGSTTEPKEYSFIDKNVSAGKYSYRLKQIDFDGSFKYSREVEVEINPKLEFSLEQNYPNPFNPTTTIKYSIPRDGFVSLKVFNVLGQQVAELVNGTVKSGSHEVTFSAENLSSGVYYYRIEGGGNIAVKKMMVVK